MFIEQYTFEASRSQSHATVCFCSPPDDGYITAETSS